MQETDSAEAPPVASIEDVVAESAERLASAEQAGIKPVKRGRGRPRKDGTVSQAPPGTGGPSSQLGSQARPGGAVPAAPQPQVVLTPIIAQAMKLPYAALAAKTKDDVWKLSEDEANVLAVQAEAVMREFLPQLNGKQAVLATFGGSIGMLTLFRWMQYQENERKRAELAKPVVEAAPHKQPVPPHVNGKAEHSDGPEMVDLAKHFGFPTQTV